MFEKLKKPIPLDFTKKKLGFSTLLIGIILTLVLGVLADNLAWGIAWLWLVLVMGVIVGIFNLFHEEGVLFMLALLVLNLTLALALNMALFSPQVINLFNAVIYLLVPAATLVSLKVLYALAVK